MWGIRTAGCCGCTKATDLCHNADSRNNESGAGAICTHQWTCCDVCGACNARRKCNHAPLCHLVVQLRWSEAVPRGSISPELSPSLSSEHHERGAGAICTHQWTCRDVCGAYNARRKCKHAPLCHLVVQLRWSEAVPRGSISTETALYCYHHALHARCRSNVHANCSSSSTGGCVRIWFCSYCAFYFDM